MKEIKINRLPAPTWRWLKVNDRNVKVPEAFVPAVTDDRAENLLTEAASANQAEGKSGLGDVFAEVIEASQVPARIYSIRGTQGRLYFRNHYTEDYMLAREEIRAEAGSRALIVMEADGTGTNGAHDIRISLEEGAKLTLVEVIRVDHAGVFLDGVYTEAADKAEFNLIQLVLGGGDVCLGEMVKLSGREAACRVDIGYLLDGNKEFDVNAVAEHTGKNTNSRIGISGVVDGTAKKTFRGTLDFVKGAAGAKGEVRDNVLLMSDEVVNRTIPLILCGEEDVEGEHGATIGKISDEAMFYFATRGIPEEQVAEMMARSMVDQVIAKIPDETLRRELLGEEDIV